MKSFRTLKEFLTNAEASTLPPLLSTSSRRVAEIYEQFVGYSRKNRGRRIYGVNTHPGHQDVRPASGDVEFQKALLAGHAISTEDAYDAFETRCIGYAKAYSVAAGGTLISPGLYEGICQAITDPHFQPHVPRLSSYSSGDVIPGAHWARELLAHLDPPHLLNPGEAMALMNGAFIHVGFSCALAKRLKRFWGLFAHVSKANAIVCGANPKNFNYVHTAEKTLIAAMSRYIADGLRRPNTDIPQDAVSVRALPQVLDALAMSAELFLSQLNQILYLPSGNPIMLPILEVDQGPREPHPQASFMNPALTIATSSVVDAVLLCAWCSVSRTQYLLSGGVKAIPQDGVVEGGIGFIQWPKLMQAMLEEARLIGARRPFGSGGATSQGIEDLWSFGTLTNECLSKVLGIVERILCFEMTLCERLSKKFRKGRSLIPSGLSVDFDKDGGVSRSDFDLILKRFEGEQGLEPLRKFFI